MQAAGTAAAAATWGRQQRSLPALLKCSHAVVSSTACRWYSSSSTPQSARVPDGAPGAADEKVAADGDKGGPSTSAREREHQAAALAQDFAKNAKQVLLGGWIAAVNVYRALTSSSEHPSTRGPSSVKVVRIKADELMAKTKQLPSVQKVSHALDQLNAVGPAVLTQPLLVKWDAFWNAYGAPVRFTLGLATTCAIWSLLDMAAVWAVGPETVPDYATLVPASMFVTWNMWYLRQRYTLDSSTVYQLSLQKLTTNAGVMEVMGAPLVASPWQASMVTGGGWHWTGAGLRLRSKRVHLLFPLRGSERRGLVCVEAKKLAGKIRFKLLSIDVPVEGGEERVYVIGSGDVYDRGHIFQELRAPFVKAVLLKQQYEAEDDADLTLDYIEGKARRRQQKDAQEDDQQDQAVEPKTEPADSSKQKPGNPSPA